MPLGGRCVPAGEERDRVADFGKALARTLAHEGGYVFHAKDPGGETYQGVTRRDHPTWPGWVIIDERKAMGGDWQAGLHESLDVLVAQLMRTYWDAVRGDDIPDQGLAELAYDVAVNMGPGAAITMLQQGLAVLARRGEVIVDGRFGGQTLAALRALDARDVAMLRSIMQALRGARYVAIALKRPESRAFIRGWMTRTGLVAA